MMLCWWGRRGDNVEGEEYDAVLVSKQMAGRSRAPRGMPLRFFAGDEGGGSLP